MLSAAQKLLGQVVDVKLRDGGAYEAVTLHQASENGVLVHKDSAERAILIRFSDIESIQKGWW